MDALPDLRAVANFGVGYDNVDVAEATRRGIVVSNTPDVLTDAVADLSVALVLDVVRGMGAAERWLRRGEWAAGGRFPLTRDVRGATVGILGLGRIGQAVAERLQAFGAIIAYHSRSPKDVSWAYHDSPVALAAASDVLVVLTPGGAGTEHLVDADVLDALGPEGYLVNVARGSVVDEKELVAALEAGRIAGAGLDVFADEPHVPGRAARARGRRAAAARRQRHRADPRGDGPAGAGQRRGLPRPGRAGHARRLIAGGPAAQSRNQVISAMPDGEKSQATVPVASAAASRAGAVRRRSPAAMPCRVRTTAQARVATATAGPEEEGGHPGDPERAPRRCRGCRATGPGGGAHPWRARRAGQGVEPVDVVGQHDEAAYAPGAPQRQQQRRPAAAPPRRPRAAGATDTSIGNGAAGVDTSRCVAAAGSRRPGGGGAAYPHKG